MPLAFFAPAARPPSYAATARNSLRHKHIPAACLYRLEPPGLLLTLAPLAAVRVGVISLLAYRRPIRTPPSVLIAQCSSALILAIAFAGLSPCTEASQAVDTQRR